MTTYIAIDGCDMSDFSSGEEQELIAQVHSIVQECTDVKAYSVAMVDDLEGEK